MDMMKRNPRSISTTVWFTAATLEDAGRARGQRGQTGGDGRQLVGAVAREAFGHRQKESVGGDHHRVGHPGGVVHEVGDQPVQVLRRLAHRAHTNAPGCRCCQGRSPGRRSFHCLRCVPAGRRGAGCSACPGRPRGRGRPGGRPGGSFRGALDQVGLGYPPRQAGGGDPARLGLRSCSARCQRSSFAERQSLGAVAAAGVRAGRRLLAHALLAVPLAVVPRRGCPASVDPRRGSPASVSSWAAEGAGPGRSKPTRSCSATSAACEDSVSGAYSDWYAVPVFVLLRPVVLVGLGFERREPVLRDPGPRPLLLDRLRIGGFRIAAVRSRKYVSSYVGAAAPRTPSAGRTRAARCTRPVRRRTRPALVVGGLLGRRWLPS